MSKWIEFFFGVRITTENSYIYYLGSGSAHGKGDLPRGEMLDLGNFQLWL